MKVVLHCWRLGTSGSQLQLKGLHLRGQDSEIEAALVIFQVFHESLEAFYALKSETVRSSKQLSKRIRVLLEKQKVPDPLDQRFCKK